MPERLRAHPKPDAKGLRVKGEPEYILWDSSVEPIRPQRTERFPPLSKNTFTGIPTVYREWRPGRKVSVHFQTLEKSNMAVESRTLFGTMHLVVCICPQRILYATTTISRVFSYDWILKDLLWLVIHIFWKIYFIDFSGSYRHWLLINSSSVWNLVFYFVHTLAKTCKITTRFPFFIALTRFPPGVTILWYFFKFLTKFQPFFPFLVITTCSWQCTACNLLYCTLSFSVSERLRKTLKSSERQFVRFERGKEERRRERNTLFLTESFKGKGHAFHKSCRILFFCRSQGWHWRQSWLRSSCQRGELFCILSCKSEVNLKGINIFKSPQNASGSERLCSSVMMLMSTWRWCQGKSQGSPGATRKLCNNQKHLFGWFHR